MNLFLSTPSARRATISKSPPQASFCYFYPRPPRGGRPRSGERALEAFEFLSTPSARRATSLPWRSARWRGYFYPRPPRGGRLHFCFGGPHCVVISIHALREEGDNAVINNLTTGTDFYPRPPRGGRLGMRVVFRGRAKISIHALREEGDRNHGDDAAALRDFYPRPPRGGRRSQSNSMDCASVFLSTPSARRATDMILNTKPDGIISIHALREEGDFQSLVLIRDELLFLSTPSARRATQRPRLHPPKQKFLSTPSARRATSWRPLSLLSRLFLSTPSARRATAEEVAQLEAIEFLSTPSARRATVHHFCVSSLFFNFYPRPPRGGRHVVQVRFVVLVRFLSTPSARRATALSHLVCDPFKISIHALREEGDRKDRVQVDRQCNFYPRPPRGGRQQKQRQNLYFQTNYTTFCTNLEEP